VRILLEHKADPNARMNNGATPLSLAMSRENNQVIQLLRKFGASGAGTRSSPKMRQQMMMDE
jgi:ankyrin repeat protein